MFSATNSNTSGAKRVRFDTDVSTDVSTTTTHSQSPSEAAKKCVTLAVASLPESTKPMAAHWCTKINTAYTKWYRHTKNLTIHAANPEFIPRSARVNFTLTGSKLVTEENDFKTLAASTKEEVEKFQQKLKELITEAAKLENSALKKELGKVIATAIISFAKVSLMSFTGKAPTSADLNYLVYETFLATFDNEPIVFSAANCSTLYTELTGSSLLETDILSGYSTTTVEFLNIFQDHCHRLFVAPLKAYSDADEANAVSAIIDQFTTSVITGSVTATTVTAMDDEPTMSNTQLESLIHSSVKKNTDAIRSQLNNQLKELTSKLSSVPKNSARGAVAGASLKKKNKKKSATTGQAQKKKNSPASTVAPRADVADKGTPVKNTGNTTTIGRDKSNRKFSSKTGAGRTKKN